MFACLCVWVSGRGGERSCYCSSCLCMCATGSYWFHFDWIRNQRKKKAHLDGRLKHEVWVDFLCILLNWTSELTSYFKKLIYDLIFKTGRIWQNTFCLIILRKILICSAACHAACFFECNCIFKLLLLFKKVKLSN